MEICGDGKRFIVECDDGNTVSGDGCSSSCTIETDWVCDSPTENGLSKCLKVTYQKLILAQKEAFPNRVYFLFQNETLVNSLKVDDVFNPLPEIRDNNNKKSAINMTFHRRNGTIFYLEMNTSNLSLLNNFMRISLSPGAFNSPVPLHPSEYNKDLKLNPVIYYNERDHLIMTVMVGIFVVILVAIFIIFLVLTPVKKAGILWILIDYLQMLSSMVYLKTSPLMPFELILTVSCILQPGYSTVEESISKRVYKTSSGVLAGLGNGRNYRIRGNSHGF